MSRKSKTRNRSRDFVDEFYDYHRKRVRVGELQKQAEASEKRAGELSAKGKRAEALKAYAKAAELFQKAIELMQEVEAFQARMGPIRR